MPRTLRLTLAVLSIGAFGTMHAQSPSHEYRPQLAVTLPRWHGAALTVLEEQHLGTAELGPVERQHGVIVAAPAYGAGVASLEMRQVVSGAGLVEHRYIPTITVSTALAPGLDFRSRTRVELRDIAGTWSQRYQERVTLARTLSARGQVVQPYAHVALSYDSRFATISRREGTLGIRLPLANGTSLDPFVLRQTDTRRATPTIVATGLTVRVAL